MDARDAALFAALLVVGSSLLTMSVVGYVMHTGRAELEADRDYWRKRYFDLKRKHAGRWGE